MRKRASPSVTVSCFWKRSDRISGCIIAPLHHYTIRRQSKAKEHNSSSYVLTVDRQTRRQIKPHSSNSSSSLKCIYADNNADKLIHTAARGDALLVPWYLVCIRQTKRQRRVAATRAKAEASSTMWHGIQGSNTACLVSVRHGVQLLLYILIVIV